MTRPGLTEHQIQDQIIGWLRFQGFYVQRLNSGAIRVDQRLVRMNKAGTPDIMAFRDVAVKQTHYDLDGSVNEGEFNHAQLIFIEVKRPGKKPTVLQSQVMQEMEEHGALCFVATSIEDVEQQLAA